jgi:hypothetical protein
MLWGGVVTSAPLAAIFAFLWIIDRAEQTRINDVARRRRQLYGTLGHKARLL